MSVKYERTASLMEAELGEEIVALDPAKGTCFGFNEVAAWVWRRIEQPQTFDQLRDGLLSEFDVDEATCSAELRELLDALERKKLIAAVQSA